MAATAWYVLTTAAGATSQAQTVGRLLYPVIWCATPAAPTVGQIWPRGNW